MSGQPTIYSYSRLTTFDQCLVRYGLRYVDKLYPDVTGVEGYVGTCVHAVVERHQKGQLEDVRLWEAFTREFSDGWSDRIRDVRERGRAYWHDYGLRCVSNYQRHALPKGLVVGIEWRHGIPLLEDPFCSFMGILDRLTIESGTYVAEDFKTGRRQERQYFLDDHQLPLYAALAVNAFDLDPNVDLVARRQYLYTGSHEEYVVTPERRDEALEWARQRASAANEFEAQFEATREAEPNVGRLCDWCQFKGNGCPAWKTSNSPI